MVRKIVSGIMSILLVLSTLSLLSYIQTVKASGTIYIRADGSIDPPTAPISTVDKVTYTLFGNITGSIVIEKDDIIVDGAGCVLQGIAGDGTSLVGRSNITIRDMEIIGFLYGILLDSSSNITVAGNTIMGNLGGIRLDSSPSNNITDNYITHNSDGIYLFNASDNIVFGNYITRNDGNGITFESCSGNSISNDNITYNAFGLVFFSSSDNRIFHNLFEYNTEYPVTLYGGANHWDNGYPSGGNYWSDYNGTDLFSGPYQNETGSDGIGDTPYVIDLQNIDRYPIFKQRHISSDVTWAPSGANEISMNTYVDAGATLTILPGVHVQFADDCSLIVKGSLNATGTEDQPIIFTSRWTIPVPGAWHTIAFEGNASEHFSLKNVIVEYAVNGVTIQSLEPVGIERSEISNCSENGILLTEEANVLISDDFIQQNMNGISGDTRDSYSGILITDNTILHNQKDGIILGTSRVYGDAFINNVTISSNTISSNGENGIQLSTFRNVANTYIRDVIVSSNIVSANGGDGAFIESAGGSSIEPGFSSFVYNVTVFSNIVFSNSINGLEIQANHPQGGHGLIYDVDVSSNNASSNGANGIRLYSSGGYGHGYRGNGYIYDTKVFSNIVSSNNGSGLSLESTSNYGGSGNIYDVNLSSNTASSNGESGITLYSIGGNSYAPGFSGYLHNSSINSNAVFSNQGNGIVLETLDMCNVTVLYNNVSYNSASGISATSSGHDAQIYDLTVKNNEFVANRMYGIWAEGLRALIAGNYLTGNTIGLTLSSSADNTTISGNNISNNVYGIYFNSSSSDNSVSGNDITNNVCGIYLDSSSNNTIYHNNFINNAIQANSSSSTNIWDDGYPSGGNCWSDYAGADVESGPYQNQTGSDGIGDAPYVIDANNVDHYPLMQRRASKGRLVLTFDTETDADIYSGDASVGSIHTPTLDTIENIGSELSNRGLKGTFFVQGACFEYQDGGVTPEATDSKNFSQIIQQLHSLGDEIGSHTYHHLNFEEDTNVDDWTRELELTENEITKAVGERPRGFRAPHYSYGHTVFNSSLLWNLLQERGYAYDSSKWHKEDDEQDNYDPYELQDGTSNLFELPVAFAHPNADGTPTMTNFADWASYIDGASNGETRVLVIHPEYLDDYGNWSAFLKVLDYIKEKQDGGVLQTVTAFDLATSAGATYSSSSLTVSIHSPANLYVTDPLGLHIGFDPILHTLVNEIPGATYSGTGTEPQVISIPYPPIGNYQILLMETAAGSYNLTVDYITPEQNPRQVFLGTISEGENLTFIAQVSQNNIVIVPEFTSLVILLPFMSIMLLAIITCRRKRCSIRR